MNLTVILELISALPAAAWTVIGTVIGGSVGFLSTWYTTRHTGRQRERERLMSLKREVYLPAAESVGRLQTMVANILNLTIADSTLNVEFTNISAALAKIHVIASETTVFSVMAFTNAVSEAYATLLPKRNQLKARHDSLTALDAAIERAHAEETRWIEAMKDMNVGASADRALWQRLNAQCDFASGQRAKLIKDREVLDRNLRKESYDAWQHAADLCSNVEKHLPDAVLRVRAELDIPIDEAAYRRLCDENARCNQELIDRFMKSTDPGQPSE